MKDIQLWRLLQDESQGSAQERKTLLLQMSALPIAQRLPYLGLLEPLLSSEDHDLAAAAYSMLAGATGYPTWKLLLQGLRHPASVVREACFEALYESAKHEPERWNHLLFSPEVSIRSRALAKCPPSYPRRQLFHLLADHQLRSQVLESLGSAVPRPEHLNLLLNFMEQQTISIARALDWLAAIPWLHQTDAYLNAIGPGRLLSKWPTQLTELEAILEKLPLQPEDPLDSLTRCLWLAMESERENLRAQGLDILNQFHNRWCRGLFQKPTFQRLTLSLLKIGFCYWDWQPEPLALCARAIPCLLTHPDIPLEVRREAAMHLRPSSAKSIVPNPLKGLLTSDLCLRKDGYLKLNTVGGLLNLIHTTPFEALLKETSEAVLFDSLAVNPEEAPSLLAIPAQTRKERQLHQKILLRLFQVENKPSPLLVTRLILQVPVDKLVFLKHIKQWEAEPIEAMLHQLLIASAGQNYSDRKLDRIAMSLGKQLLPKHLKSVLKVLAQSVPHDLRGTTSAEVEESRAEIYPHLSSLALSCLVQVGRKTNASSLAKSVAEHSESEILALLLLLQFCPNFPYERERELCIVLEEQGSDAVKAALPHASLSTVENKRLAPRQRGVATPLSQKEAERIETCDESALDSHLQVCLARPVTQLCDALKARQAPSPNTTACAALLSCEDKLEEVDSTLALFHEDNPNFNKELSALMTRYFERAENLPLPATAWLWRWEKHHNAFIQHLLALPLSLCEALQSTLEWKSQTLAHHFWLATLHMLRRWRWRNRDKLQEVWTQDIPTLLVDFLLPPTYRSAANGKTPPPWVKRNIPSFIQREAARTLAALQKTGLFVHEMDSQKQRLIPFLFQLSPAIQLLLREWLNSSEVSIRRKKQVAATGDVEPDLLLQVRKNYVPHKLKEYCRSTQQQVVEEAASQLLTLAAEGAQTLLDLLLEEQPVTHYRTLTDTIPLWEDSACAQRLLRSLDAFREDPERQFLLAIRLCERGAHHGWKTALNALLVEVEEDWFLPEDWAKLQSVESSLHKLSLALIKSPLYGVFSRTLPYLTNPDTTYDRSIQTALIRFLECGTERPMLYRLQAANTLKRHGCWEGLPLICSRVLAKKSGPLHQVKEWKALWADAPDNLFLSNINSALLMGEQQIHWKHLLDCLQHEAVPSLPKQEAVLKILQTTRQAWIQQKVMPLIQPSKQRHQTIQALAQAIAWGIRRGRELTGKIFRIELLGGDDLGYTFLTGSSIFANPLPILRKEKHGQEVYKGLLLHEIGHHIYHADPHSQEYWKKAVKEKMVRWLNLVADEQLERNIRAKGTGEETLLKQLNAYAFQHISKSMRFSDLLQLLGVNAFKVLHQTPLRPSHRPKHVVVSQGKFFMALEAGGYSLPRFFRALRMGLGNRHNDPKVKQALQLFGKKFRHSCMQEMLDISYQLRNIFREEVNLLKMLSQDTLSTGVCNEEIVAGSGGITQEEIEKEVEKILRGQVNRNNKSNHNSKWEKWINLTEEESFSLIPNVVPLVHNPSEHRPYSEQVRRWSHKVRDELQRLGLGFVTQHRRVRGYRLETPALSSSLLRGDPRILQSRKMVPSADLFVGILVDCSGSMSINDNLEKAKRFATLLADAAAPLRGVEARFFGFTDTTLYDAGNAQRCAVHALELGGGNNDAAALWHAAQIARKSRRRAKLLIMISDGSPTECSVLALQKLVQRLTHRMHICCAQVAVSPIDEVCFPHYIELTESNLSLAIQRFGVILRNLIGKALRM